MVFLVIPFKLIKHELVGFIIMFNVHYAETSHTQIQQLYSTTDIINVSVILIWILMSVFICKVMFNTDFARLIFYFQVFVHSTQN